MVRILGGVTEEFCKIINSSFNEQKLQIDTWLANLNSSEVRRRFETIDINEINSKESFINIIKSIFYLANKDATKPSLTSRVGYSVNKLVRMLDSRKSFIKKFFKDDTHEYKQFINTIFNNNDSSNYYEAELLNKSIKNIDIYNNETYGIEYIEIEIFLLNYFKLACNKETNLNNEVYHYWDMCKVPGIVEKLYPSEDIHRNAVFPQAREIFTKFIAEKVLDQFLLQTIIQNHRIHGAYRLGNLPYEVFENLEKFEAFLNMQDENKWNSLSEYKRFFNFAKQESPNDIYFNFEKININKD